MDAIGHNHAMETAIADLVDNSVDAGASRVLIRFVQSDGLLVGLYTVDDGFGMDEAVIDDAMTVGGDRPYREGDLGHFGLGLKAASLSQADSLTVVSRGREGRTIGRRWLVEGARKGFECDVLEPGFCEREISRSWGEFQPTTGTVVRWDRVRGFPGASDPSVTQAYLQDTVDRLRRHLGLTFHRILQAERIWLSIDVEDVGTEERGAVFTVEPIDPFAYVRTGRPGYPKALRTDVDGRPLTLHCHIWPGRSHAPEFRLGLGSPDLYQGFYFYRADRLLQAGGWNRVYHTDREHQLARVAVDIDDGHAVHLRMNPEKSRLDTDTHFVRALEEARATDGATFKTFLEDARETYKRSRKRNKNRPKVMPPGSGFDPEVKRAIRDELEFLPGEPPIAIRWERLEDAEFFHINREERTIRLNRRYRHAILGDKGGSLNDAPLVKALLYLLVEEVFHGMYLGWRDKDNIELWQAVLSTAAKAEEKR